MKNLEESVLVSVQDFEYLQHVSSFSSELKCWYAQDGESDVVWFFPKVS